MSTRKSLIIGFELAIKGHLTNKIPVTSEMAGISFLG